MSATVPAIYSPQQYRSLEIWYDYLEDTYPVLRELQFNSIPEDSNCFAVFVDYRKHPYMEYVFRNIIHFLGDGWGLQIFVWPENRAFVENIVTDWKHVHLIELSYEHGIADPVDNTLRSEKFWDQVKGEKQLVFDLDSLLCRSGIEDFMQFDYIGAPWLDSHAVSPACKLGSGGLSLRSKKVMLEICSETNTSAQLVAQEDLYFSVNMHLEPEKYHLPPIETARQFAVEGVFHPQPLGLHRPWMCMNPEQINELLGTIDYSS